MSPSSLVAWVTAAFDLARVGDVAWIGTDLAAGGGADLVRRGGEDVFPAREQGDVRTGAVERFGHGPAEAEACAGDQGRLAGEV